MENFFNLSSNVMCILSDQYIIIQANLSFEKILGYPIGETIQKPLLDFFHTDERALMQKSLVDSASSSKSLQINSRMITKDGKVKWFTWTISNPTNTPNIYAVAHDYTQNQETENKLVRQNREIAEERAKMKAMLANIGDGIIGISDTGNILYINKSAETLLGYSEAELKNKLFFHSIPTVDAKGNPVDTAKLPIRNAMMTGRTSFSRNFQFVKKDGKPLPVSITASTVKNQGAVTGGVVVFRDITQEREIDRMKTEFISLASHQLRTPLSAVKWFAEMLLDGDMGKLTEEQLEVIQNIYKSNQRMIELVNSLLNISRIESGRLIVEPKPTNLKELVDEVLVELQPKINEKKLKFAFSIHDNLPLINIDPKLVRHVYMNLLTNAIKYTPIGGEIVVMISNRGKEIISQVSDNGYGIPKNQQEHVFEKFFRALNIKKIETDGTGLGLYLVKQIVIASGGNVWFESEEGKGTSFWFSLPIEGSKIRVGEVSIDS